MNRLKLGFLSSHNYFSKHAFSGTLLSMYKSLKYQDLELINLGWPQKQSSLNRILRKLRFKGNSALKIESADFENISKQFNKLIKKQLKQRTCDYIFAPVASLELSTVETEIPIIYASDATFKLLNGAYKLNLSEQERIIRNQLEQSAIDRASKVVYSSDWAAQSAIQDYDAKPEKISVIDYGANLEDIPNQNEIFSRCTNEICKLLFIGRDWERKGGEIAYRTLLALLDQGMDAQLCIIGCTPPKHIQHPNLQIIPYLNKDLPKHQAQLRKIFLKANFFLFPTRADCSPIVVCEANAFGIPVIGSAVGGMPSLIKTGKNGYILDASASEKKYATIISEVFDNRLAYRKLIASSREEYEQRLNWNKWGKRMAEIMDSQ